MVKFHLRNKEIVLRRYLAKTPLCVEKHRTEARTATHAFKKIFILSNCKIIFNFFFLERKKEKEKITKSNDVWLSSTHLVYYSYKLNEPFVF